jgi:hypothetical protein
LLVLFHRSFSLYCPLSEPVLNFLLKWFVEGCHRFCHLELAHYTLWSFLLRFWQICWQMMFPFVGSSWMQFPHEFRWQLRQWLLVGEVSMYGCTFSNLCFTVLIVWQKKFTKEGGVTPHLANKV